MPTSTHKFELGQKVAIEKKVRMAITEHVVPRLYEIIEVSIKMADETCYLMERIDSRQNRERVKESEIVAAQDVKGYILAALAQALQDYANTEFKVG